MDEDDKLEIINAPKPLPEANNFWRSCPRILEYLPEAACPKGKPTINESNGKIQDEPSCPWWINSKLHHYCFWRYIQDKSGPDGVMNELVQSELAELFGFSNTKTHFVLKQAIEEVTAALKLYEAIELVKELETEDLDDIINPKDIDAEDENM